MVNLIAKAEAVMELIEADTSALAVALPAAVDFQGRSFHIRRSVQYLSD